VQATLARVVVLGMAVLAVFVQIGVWGATKIRSDGALLDSWQPYFGWPYGLAFAAFQIGVCYWLRIDRGAVWFVRTRTIGGALLVLVMVARRQLGAARGGRRDRARLRSRRARPRGRALRRPPDPGQQVASRLRELTAG